MLKLYVKSKVALAELKENVEGASLIEYSLLIGLITGAVILTIGFVADKVDGAWSGLDNNWT